MPLMNRRSIYKDGTECRMEVVEILIYYDNFGVKCNNL